MGIVPFKVEANGSLTGSDMLSNQMASDEALAHCRAVQKALLAAWPKG